MPDQDPEKAFLDKAGSLIPGIGGYRDAAARRGTDEQVRGHLASRLDDLAARFIAIREAADGEGDLDMVDDLDRIHERIGRTAEALRGADYGKCRFFSDGAVEEGLLSRICSYDTAMLEDLDLLTADVEDLKYETIGTLTLREVEGTLASIDLKLANRRDMFDMGSS